MNTQKAAKVMRRESAYKSKRNKDGRGIKHANWMLDGIIEGYIQGEKAHRWLSYAQAIYVEKEIAPLEYMKQINRDA